MNQGLIADYSNCTHPVKWRRGHTKRGTEIRRCAFCQTSFYIDAAYYKLPPEGLARIWKMRQSGMRAVHIAAEMGCCTSTVYYSLRKMRRILAGRV